MAIQTLAEYVEQEIAGIFKRVAEKVGSGELVNDMTPDESAGVPMAIFTAHMAMEDAWKRVSDITQGRQEWQSASLTCGRCSSWPSCSSRAEAGVWRSSRGGCGR